MFMILRIICLLAAVILGYFTWTEATLASRSTANPEEISLKALIARGPHGNANVRVTGFVQCPDSCPYFGGGTRENFNEVFVPIEEVNQGKKEPLKPSNVQALFYSRNVHNESELDARLKKPNFQGLVINSIHHLAWYLPGDLQKDYPGTDFNKCLIIEEGRVPPSWGRVFLFGAGSAGALLVGVVLFVFSRSRKKRMSKPRSSKRRE